MACHCDNLENNAEDEYRLFVYIEMLPLGSITYFFLEIICKYKWHCFSSDFGC